MCEVKFCGKCGDELVLGENWLESQARFGNYTCRPCGAEACRKYYRANLRGYLRRALKQNFGMTLTEYDLMSNSQGDVCKICGGINADGRRLAVDHNHKTGKIRGLLCQKCNLILGYANEDTEILARAIVYLKEANNEN